MKRERIHVAIFMFFKYDYHSFSLHKPPLDGDRKQLNSVVFKKIEHININFLSHSV